MSNKLAKCFVVLLTAIGITFVAAPAGAQTITGTIRGAVTDSSGAVIPNATVTATNAATGVKTATVTNHDGLYNIQFLPIGSYTITVTSAGFDTATIGPFALEIDQIAKFNVSLKIGSTSETLQVSAEDSPLLQTENSTLGATINSQTLSTLPLNGLNFQSATLFVPGVVNPGLASMGGQDGNERDVDWYGSPSFNGNRGQANNYVLDGVEMNETLNNVAAYSPAPDSIQEMHVITGNADAEYGNVNGGEVLVVTKGGTNQFHGSAYDYLENNNMSGTPWSQSYIYGLPDQPYTQNQFGATIGGPIKRDKLFFFGDYLGFRYHHGGQGAATVATNDMRTGNFSELLGSQFGDIQLYNNQNGAGYSNATMYNNNQIPIVNPVAKFLFSHPNVYPASNRAAVPGLGDLDNYEGPQKGYTVNDQGDVRVDYHINDSNTLMGRYSIGDAYDFSSTVLPVQFPTLNDYPFQNLVLNFVHTFTPSLVNEFRAGVSRTIFNSGVPNDPTGVFGVSGNSTVGLPMSNQPFPGFSEMGFSTWESNVGTEAIVTQFHENNFYYADNLTWARGRHAFKFGAQILRYQQNYYYSGNSGALGQFYYNGQYTGNGTSSGTGYGFADFVLDQGASASIGGVAGDVGQRQYRLAFFAQDDWRLLPNLTINLGVRYGYDQPIYEVNNKEVSVNLSNPNDITLAGLEFAGQDGNSQALYNPFKLGVMPRIGFAWSVSNRFVLRGGYGITDALEGTGINRRMTQNYPFQGSFTAGTIGPGPTSNGSAPLPVENGFTYGAAALGTPQENYTNFLAWDPHLKPALVQQFNLSWQYMLTPAWTAQLGYVGELGQHLIVPNEVNQWASPTTGNAANYDCSGAVATPAPSCGLTGNYGNLGETTTNAYSNYNAMQASLIHLPTHGLGYRFNYTWSKAMTNNAGFYGAPNVAVATEFFFQDIHNPKGDYGPAGDDSRNVFNGYWSYQLPFGRGEKFGGNMNRALDQVAGGWKVSGSVVMYSGWPVTMSMDYYTPYYVNAWTAHTQQLRPMHIANRTVQNWFGTDPSATPCLNYDANGNIIDNGTCAYAMESFNGFGNAHNGTERAPGFRQVDLSAMKVFPITESNSIELRGDAFNALNIASYGAPNSVIYSPGFGQITNTNSSQRIMQVSMHYRF